MRSWLEDERRRGAVDNFGRDQLPYISLEKIGHTDRMLQINDLGVNARGRI
jgi:hypothetical protein